MTGEDWINGFLSRHPDLAYHKRQRLSQARCEGIN